ncbi:FAS-associated factor2 [Porites harrisoni]
MVPLVLYFAEFSSPEIHQEDFCRTNRELREQQDREYQESLAQDQERAEGLREEERNRAEAERRNAEAIREAREGLPPEPLENENTLTVRIRGPNGNSVLRTFFNHETTQVLFRAAFALLSLPSQDFVIHRHQGPPIHNDGSSLVDLSLNNYTVLIIEMQDESGP